MASEQEAGGLSFIVFIPIIICIVAILILLEIRQQQRHPTAYAPVHITQANDDDETMAFNEDDDDEEEDLENDPGEGSSTAVRVKKVGKKRGEKLKRKEQMRQYREYLDQQREVRKAQDEILEAEFQRKKEEQSIKRADELDKRRKQLAKKQKQEEKEEQKKMKAETKESKRKEGVFSKYSEKLNKLVQETKLCDMNELSKKLGISVEDVVFVLNELCSTNSHYALSLWSDTNTFLFVTKEDYKTFENLLKDKGRLSIHDAFSF
ncbi:hypothetical protein K501DRAFT_332181 [Backusella circina FSU 941]|nr:hypothetical protein K501DRAFT_332181 [Backusella circina FSU 941]